MKHTAQQVIMPKMHCVDPPFEAASHAALLTAAPVRLPLVERYQAEANSVPERLDGVEQQEANQPAAPTRGACQPPEAPHNHCALVRLAGDQDPPA
eukprot:11956548-Alexandrium_andersonii.AAC.1